MGMLLLSRHQHLSYIMTTTIPLSRYEAWPATECYPAKVRHTWYNKNGLCCHAFILSCEDWGNGDEDAAICAVAIAKARGGIADISRVMEEKR